MPPVPKAKGRWIHRLVIRFLTVALAVLVYWLLGFVLRDLETADGPTLDTFETRHVPVRLTGQRDQLSKDLTALGREIEQQREQQRVLGDSTTNLQQTLDQILDLRQLNVEKNRPPTEAEDESFQASLDLFLSNQTRYQEMSRALADLVARRQAMEDELRAVEAEIAEARQPAVEEFQAAWQRHRWRMAAMQLAVLVPLLAAAGWLVVRRRGGLYFPLVLAFGGATLVKAAVVMHEYFPARWFKYLLVVALIAAVARMLVHFIRTIAFPKADWLVNQYREAYERFLCPVCEYPIRIGPRRFLFWTRRTVNRLVTPSEGGRPEEESYVCPACGTRLFEDCPACHGIRHSLLPTCRHCGDTRVVAAIPEAPPGEGAPPGSDTPRSP